MNQATPILKRYVEGEITAAQAADLLGPGTAIAEVVLEAAKRFGRLPCPDDAFTRGELARALIILGLSPMRTPPSGNSLKNDLPEPDTVP